MNDLRLSLQSHFKCYPKQEDDKDNKGYSLPCRRWRWVETLIAMEALLELLWGGLGGGECRGFGFALEMHDCLGTFVLPEMGKSGRGFHYHVSIPTISDASRLLYLPPRPCSLLCRYFTEAVLVYQRVSVSCVVEKSTEEKSKYLSLRKGQWLAPNI
jgi:hypothetical protein